MKWATMFSNRSYVKLFLVLAFLLVSTPALAACNGDGDGDEDDSAGEPDIQTEAPDEPTPTVEEESGEETESTDTPESEEPTSAPEEPEESPTEEDDSEGADEEATPQEEDEADQGDDEGDTPPAEEAGGEGSVLVYLVRDEEIAVASRTIAGTPEVAAGALNELFTGVTPYDEGIGMTTEIPEGTQLLDINVQDDGTAIVDVSEEFGSGGGSFSMQMRVAQVVFTLTQFQTVDQVQFRVEGQEIDGLGGEGLIIDEPLDRADFEDQSPAILVESPTPGQQVSSPIELRGTSNVFEATMQVEIIDNSGEVIHEDTITATSGTGTRGEFEAEIPVEVTQEGFGTVVMFELSARDGSRINVVEVPVDLRQ